jgi:D-aminoacyl-tRNA deacylase
MNAIIISKTDIASCNIFDNLIKLKDWEKKGEFLDNPLFFHDDLCIATIPDEHIFHDNVDLDLESDCGIKPECIIYASRHRSESGNRSLTVHPIGNFSKAEFGGKSQTLVPSSPHLMTQALRILKKKAKNLHYSVSFEATHHGPYLETPTFFIEIGSDEDAWRDENAAIAIAETILEVKSKEYPVAIGVGGGHYAPRFTDLVMEREISLGHIIPTYAIENLVSDISQEIITKTYGVENVYFHKKRLKGGQYSTWKEIFSNSGLKIVKSADLNLLKED